MKKVLMIELLLNAGDAARAADDGVYTEEIHVSTERSAPRPVSVWQIPWPTNPDAGL